MQGTYRVRVQTYVRKRYFILYIIVLVALLVVALRAMYDAPNYPTTYTKWWYLDVPWLFIVIAGWLPTFQMLHYRKTFVSAQVDMDNRNCLLGGKFEGEWTIKKGYPRQAASPHASVLILLIFILILFALEVMVFFHVWLNPAYVPSTANKVNSVQGFFTPTILISVLMRMGSFLKYPNAMILTQRGRWLAVQFEDGSSWANLE